MRINRMAAIAAAAALAFGVGGVWRRRRRRLGHRHGHRLAARPASWREAQNAEQTQVRRQGRPARPRPADRHGTYEGFDIEIAQDHRQGPRRRRGATSSGRRRCRPTASRYIEQGTGRRRGRHLHDQRRAQEEGQLRRPVLRRRPGPAGPDRLHRSPARSRWPARRSARSPARRRPSGSRPSTRTPQLQQFDAYSKCVDGAGRRPGRRGHHRRHHPRRATPRSRSTRASSRWSARRSPRSRTASA